MLSPIIISVICIVGILLMFMVWFNVKSFINMPLINMNPTRNPFVPTEGGRKRIKKIKNKK